MVTIPGGSYVDTGKTITPPSGYIPVAYTSFEPASGASAIVQLRIKKDGADYTLSAVPRNVSSSQNKHPVSADVLYVHSSLVNDQRS